MKATGIVRRVNETGAIIIPKEIRKKFHIRKDTPLEFYLEDNDIILRKYNSLQDELLLILENLKVTISQDDDCIKYKDEILTEIREIEEILSEEESLQ